MRRTTRITKALRAEQAVEHEKQKGGGKAAASHAPMSKADFDGIMKKYWGGN